MASLLDVAGLAFFLPVFVFLLIFTILLGVLEKTKLLGENKTLNVTAAFSIAAVAIFAGKLTGLISQVIPWIIFILILLVLIFGIYGFFGVGRTDIWALFGEPTPFILILIITIVGISVVFEESLSPYQNVTIETPTGTQGTVQVAGGANPRTETVRTLSHPRILGALFILVVAASTVHYLTKKFEPRKEA